MQYLSLLHFAVAVYGFTPLQQINSKYNVNRPPVSITSKYGHLVIVVSEGNTGLNPERQVHAEHNPLSTFCLRIKVLNDG